MALCESVRPPVTATPERQIDLLFMRQQADAEYRKISHNGGSRVVLGAQVLGAARVRGAGISRYEALAIMHGAPPTAEPDPLTSRERAVAALMAEGLSGRQIAEWLVLPSGPWTHCRAHPGQARVRFQGPDRCLTRRRRARLIEYQEAQ
jgi:hypothetical protein